MKEKERDGDEIRRHVMYAEWLHRLGCGMEFMKHSKDQTTNVCHRDASERERRVKTMCVCAPLARYIDH